MNLTENMLGVQCRERCIGRPGRMTAMMLDSAEGKNNHGTPTQQKERVRPHAWNNASASATCEGSAPSSSSVVGSRSPQMIDNLSTNNGAHETRKACSSSLASCKVRSSSVVCCAVLPLAHAPHAMWVRSHRRVVDARLQKLLVQLVALGVDDAQRSNSSLNCTQRPFASVHRIGETGALTQWQLRVASMAAKWARAQLREYRSVAES